jgi:hypothetical protein
MVEQDHHQQFQVQMSHTLAEVVEALEPTQPSLVEVMEEQEAVEQQDFLQRILALIQELLVQQIVAEAVVHDLQILMRFPHHLLRW